MKNVRWPLIIAGCILVSLASRALGLELQLGETETGSISLPGQAGSYTFGANAGEVVDFAATTTSGALSPKLQLYDSHGKLIATAYNGYCQGSSIEMNTVLLTETNVYTLDISDCSGTNTGKYALYGQSTNHPMDAKSLPFAETQAGNIGSAAQSNTYTFEANVNDEIDFTVTTTNGSLSPKIRLYSGSNGTLVDQAWNGYCQGSTLEMNTVKIPATGTYTVLVGDCSDTNTGEYEIYAQRTNHPSNPASLPLGETQSGEIRVAGQNNTYTFVANANDEIDFTMTTTSGSLSPKIRIYEPNGTPLTQGWNGYCQGSTLELNTVQIPTTGTYTVLVGDCSDTNTGSYNLYAQRTNNPSGAAILPFGPGQNNLIGLAAQSITYIFSGSQNEVIDFTMTTTSGALSPKIRLYKPDGTLLDQAWNGYCQGATLEMNTVKLPVTGTYILLVGDCSDTQIGNYAIYAQSVNMPFGPAPVRWGQVQSSDIGSAALSNTYVFKGVSNNSINLTMVATGAVSPKIRIYNPDGTLLSQAWNGYCQGSTVALNSVMLPQDGDYTILVGDCSDTNTGKYDLSSQCFGACPAMPAITWTPPAAITYCTALSATQLNASANIAGHFTYLPTSGSVLSLGPHNLSTTFTPNNTAQYANARDFVQLTVKRAPSSTLLTTSADPTTFGEPVTFTATVKPSGCGAAGTVTFMNGTSALGTVVLSSGVAKLTTSTLFAGSYTITAIYGGSPEFFGSTSAAVTQNVRKAPTSTSARASQNPSKAGQPVTFTATVTSTVGIPHGSVTFKNGTFTWGTVALINGKASFTVSMQSKGSHSITAEYGGGINFLGSTSPVLIHVVD